MPHDSPSGCDILIWAEDPANIAFSSSRAWGQAIDIKNCPHRGWGAEECPTGEYRMKVVYIPDKRKSDIEYLLDPLQELWANSIEDDALELTALKKKFALRRYRINLDALSTTDKDAITKDDQQYCTIAGGTLVGNTLDDINHPELVESYPLKDRESERTMKLAYIRLQFVPQPTDWATNKSLFDHIDTTVLEGAIIAQITGG